MNQKIPSLRLVVLLTSETAFLEVNGVPSVIRAIEGLRVFWPTLPLTIVVSPEFSSALYTLLQEHRVSHEMLLCNPSDSRELLEALLSESAQFEGVIIHDASRPLTHPELLVRLMGAFKSGVDAVRPSIAFTETLKIVKPDGVIRETLDRTSVKHISSPEIIRTSAFATQTQHRSGELGGWFVPLKKGSQIEHIEGAPEGLRINSEAERDLLESFLHWKQLNV
ncbi:MAG: 2-C-methyl-D-erythritol 4-phosphate cytidylyltransferase [Actinobacteria bacterium]|nr:2-C-methyl-D-erythritol 4-phosphate cytidylyltransferase [Actinomycetota bacterium]